MLTLAQDKKLLLPRWFPFRYHAEQQALWHCKKRFVGVPAGRGSGKTELAERRLVRFLPVKKPWHDPRYFYGAPTQEQATRIAWQDLLDLIPREWVRKKSESEHYIQTIFGSTLWVFGLDKPQRAEGKQWDGCVLDESSDLKPGIFERTVIPMLSWRNGWCWRIGVPKRQGCGAAEFREFCERAMPKQVMFESEHGTTAETAEHKDGNKTTAVFTWPSADILPPEAIEEARRNMDPKDFREQFEACWETAGGAVYHAFDEAFNVRPCEYRGEMPLIVGSDFNVDPMAWVIGHVYPNRVEWIDEIWLRDTNTQATLDMLYRRYQNHRGGFRFYGDATSQARSTNAKDTDYVQILNDERFKRLGRTVHYPKANPGRENRFAATNAMFCNAAGDRRQFASPNCKHLIGDWKARYFKPGTREVADSGDIGHASDAADYVVHAIFPLRVLIEYEPQGVVMIPGAQ